jgi:hypothetical protein
MSRICPQCSQTNQDDTTFCRFCGYRFQTNEPADIDATIRQGSLASVPANADPGSTLKTGDQQPAAAQPAPAMMTPQPQPAPAYPPQVATPNPGQPQPQAPYMPQPVQQQQQQAYQMPPALAYGQAPYGAPMAPNASSSGLARAFADKGTPVHHQSWLLDGKQVPPANLRASLLENVQRQGVMGVTASFERLREQGVMMEERDYVRVQYGTSSVFVYMAPMGQNLYVSRTSAVRQPYSPIRIGVVLGLFVLMLISLIVMIIANSSDRTSDFVNGLGVFFTYAFFGLLFYFIYLVIRSIVFLLTDKDFLAVLRPNRLHDFTQDTLSSIEKITDKAIRETLRQAGLDAEEITSAAQSYAPQQPLHRF